MDTKSKGATPCDEDKLKIRVMTMPEGWEALSAVVANRAAEIAQRSGGSPDQNLDTWGLAESQVEKPLMCGFISKEGGGCRVTLNSSSVGRNEIDISAEPHRLILLGWNKARGEKERGEPAVRVLSLRDEVDPSSLKIRQAGHMLDIELDSCAACGSVLSTPRTAA